MLMVAYIVDTEWKSLQVLMMAAVCNKCHAMILTTIRSFVRAYFQLLRLWRLIFRLAVPVRIDSWVRLASHVVMPHARCSSCKCDSSNVRMPSKACIDNRQFSAYGFQAFIVFRMNSFIAWYDSQSSKSPRGFLKEKN